MFVLTWDTETTDGGLFSPQYCLVSPPPLRGKDNQVCVQQGGCRQLTSSSISKSITLKMKPLGTLEVYITEYVRSKPG